MTEVTEVTDAPDVPDVPDAPDVDLARPFTPQRLRLYLVIASVQSGVGAVCAVGVGLGLLDANRALDVVANLANVIAMVALPLAVILLVQDPVTRAAELTLVWLPFTAAAQLTFELAWVIGQLFDVWKPTDDPGWTWMWWQFALADTRYFGENPFIFGMEVAAVAAAVVVTISFVQLIRPGLPDAARVRALAIGLIGLAALTLNTLVYFASLLRNGMADVGQGTYGVVKIVLLNGPYLVFPVLVLAAMVLLIEHLATRRSSPDPLSR